MRLIFKIIFGLGLFLILYTLSPPPIYALACSGTGYTCRKFDCAPGEVEDITRECNPDDYICCKKVPTSTPRPQPTNTPYVPASPTATQAPLCRCQNGKCVGDLTKCKYIAVGCRTCSDPTKNADILEYCDNQACNPPRQCAGYSASCASNCKKDAPGCYAVPVPADCGYNAPGCNRCGYARVEAIYCNGIHCGDTCVPHALCSNSPWCSGGGGGGSNPYLSIQLVDSSLAFWCATLGMTT